MHVLPRRASNVVHPWRIFRHHRGRRSTGRSRADSFGGWNPLSAWRARRRRAYGIVTHALGRDGHRTPRRDHREGDTGKSVAVVGDGAVGLCGVIAAKRLGAEQIIILGRHADRIAPAKDLGATT